MEVLHPEERIQAAIHKVTDALAVKARQPDRVNCIVVSVRYGADKYYVNKNDAWGRNHPFVVEGYLGSFYLVLSGTTVSTPLLSKADPFRLTQSNVIVSPVMEPCGLCVRVSFRALCDFELPPSVRQSVTAGAGEGATIDGGFESDIG